MADKRNAHINMDVFEIVLSKFKNKIKQYII